MKRISRHISGAFLAGIVALLPIGGFILAVVYLEAAIAGSWLRQQPFYFPGLGLILAVITIYLIGVTVSTILGRWLWRRCDRLLDELPALGQLYRSLKQILGYGEGKDGIFESVVLVPARDNAALELGLVTNLTVDAQGREQLVVFVPGSPNPTTGRLVVLPAHETRSLDVPVNQAFKALVSVGKTPFLTREEARNVLGD